MPESRDHRNQLLQDLGYGDMIERVRLLNLLTRMEHEAMVEGLDQRLNQIGLAIEDVPIDPDDIDGFLKRLGYTSAVERSKLKDLATRSIGS